MEVTTATLLDTRYKRKKKTTFPVVIQVTHDRVPVKFPIGIELSERDFKKLSAPRINDQLTEAKKKINEEEKRAQYIIDHMGTFTFHAFREEFYKNNNSKRRKKKDIPHKRGIEDTLPLVASSRPLPSITEGKNTKYGKRKFDRILSKVDYEKLGPLAVAFGEYIKLLELQERIGTAKAYFSTLMSLLEFRKCLRLEDITVQFLYEFEQWHLCRKNSLTTIGYYLRSLRAIINLPKNKKLLNDEAYPFGRGKYVIPAGTNTKKALDLKEIKILYDYQGEVENKNGRSELFGRDMWFFGFFANGINPKDIAHLKYSSIEEDFIIIIRVKTKFTTRSKPKPLYIPINEDMKTIMEEWGNADKSPDNFIFPVLTPGLSAYREHELVQEFIAFINDTMRRICKKVGIKKKVRTMEYRHSMATVLKRAGVSTEFIQEVLGHSDVRVTENYLASFELEVKKKYAQHLNSFKNINTDQGSAA